jgi:hypothetical protein
VNEEHRLLVTTTQHLSPEEAEVLNAPASFTWKGDDEYFKRVSHLSGAGEYGWIFWCGSHGDPYQNKEEDWPGLTAVIEYCRKHGYRYVMLDRDGEELEDVKVYEW